MSLDLTLPAEQRPIHERFDGLLWDLWRYSILSESQCASYRGCDLVTMRRIFDVAAKAAGFSDRMEAQR